MDTVEGFLEISEVDMELGVPLHTLFDDVTKGEYLIDATSSPAKTDLLFS